MKELSDRSKEINSKLKTFLSNMRYNDAKNMLNTYL